MKEQTGLIKSKAQAKTSPSTEQSTSYSESLFEEIWAKIQLKLNEWIENTLPPRGDQNYIVAPEVVALYSLGQEYAISDF